MTVNVQRQLERQKKHLHQNPIPEPEYTCYTLANFDFSSPCCSAELHVLYPQSLFFP